MAATFRINYLEFPSADLAGTQHFFAEAFGWSFTDYGPNYRGLDDAGLDAGIDGGPERVAAPLPVILTNDLDQALLQVTAAGGVITQEPFDFPGGRRFHFREPGGNELAVWIERA